MATVVINGVSYPFINFGDPEMAGRTAGDIEKADFVGQWDDGGVVDIRWKDGSASQIGYGRPNFAQ